MKLKIELGALSPKLSVQLEGLLPPEKLAVFDGHATAITRLHIHGLISDAESDRARKRLMRKIGARPLSGAVAPAQDSPNEQSSASPLAEGGSIAD